MNRFAVFGMGMLMGACVLAQPAVRTMAQDKAADKTEDEIAATLKAGRVLKKGRKVPVTVNLSHENSGFPVLPEELEVVHTKKLHLMAVDPSLSDYQHIHPVPVHTPGDYVFLMTPQTECGYRAWLDIDTVNSEQQFLTVDIPGESACEEAEIDKTEKLEHRTDDFRYSLTFDTGTLTEGQDTMATLEVRDGGGRPFDELEPIMGAFAHLVGFYDDYEHIAHLHPTGDKPGVDALWGGPQLQFHIKPERAGFLKFYGQVSIEGQTHFIPLGAPVAPAAPEPEQSAAAGEEENYDFLESTFTAESGEAPSDDMSADEAGTDEGM